MGISKVVKALDYALQHAPSYAQPSGLWGQKIAITTSSGVIIKNDDLDFTFNVPFDDDLEPNEADVTIYNLSDETSSKIKYNDEIIITAGYGEDTGIIFVGRVSKAFTNWQGNDRVTEISAIDTQNLDNIELEDISYGAGTTAQTILKDLISKLNLPVAVSKPRRDYTYADKVNVTGKLLDNIKKFSEVCGVSTYINQGKVYTRYIKDGDNIGFNISVETGMIDDPQIFEEEQTAEDFKETITGYDVKLLLQHRITTASIINIKSRNVTGQYRVRSGKHTYDGINMITEIEVI